MNMYNIRSHIHYTFSLVLIISVGVSRSTDGTPTGR